MTSYTMGRRQHMRIPGQAYLAACQSGQTFWTSHRQVWSPDGRTLILYGGVGSGLGSDIWLCVVASG